MQRAFDLIKEKLREKAMAENEPVYTGDVITDLYFELNNALDAVDEVASEYGEEVCEWERQDLTVGFQSWFTKCRETGLEMQGHIFNEWKFCPYCGKKIKVVE